MLPEVRVPAESRWVAFVRLMVCSWARAAGLDGDRVEDLRIAVSEATTNAILAHTRNNTTDHVVVRFGAQGDDFAVEIHDVGPGFDPEPTAPDRDLTEEGGLGLYLIRELADEVDFRRSDQGMVVAMRFKLALA